MLKISYFTGLRDLNTNALITSSNFCNAFIRKSISEIFWREIFNMDAVNEYIVAGIKEFDNGPSIMIAAKNLCNFGIVSFLVKK